MVPDTGFISCNGGQTLVILLAGGDRHMQNQDIKTARELARQL
jgi:putative component of toxin-antitoxin plasmid stabilization module